MVDVVRVEDDGSVVVVDGGESIVAQQAEAARDAALAAADGAAADVAAQLANDLAASAAQALSAQAAAQAAAAAIPALMNRTSGRRASDTALWTVLRATPAWGFGVRGDIEQTLADTLRFEFDPATLAPLGPAGSGSRTNALLWSSDLTQAVWRKVNATVALTTGADGTANGASVITASASDAWVAQYGSGSAAGSHGFSIAIRRRTGTGEVRLSRGQTTGGAAAGPALFQSDFSSPAGWTFGTGWAVPGGQLVGAGVGTANVASISLPAALVFGLAYAVTYTIASISGGGVRFRFDGGTAVEGATRSIAGTFTDVIRRNAAHTQLRIFPQAAGVNVVITNITIRPYMQPPLALTNQWQRIDLGLDTTTSLRPQPAIAIYLAAPGDQVEIDFPQAEPGPFVGPIIGRSLASPAVRAQSVVNIPVQQLGTEMGYRQGMLLLDVASQPGPFSSANDPDWMGICSWGDGTADERLGAVMNPAHTSIEARLTAGGIVRTPSVVMIAPPAASEVFRVAISWNLDAVSPGVGWLQICARGQQGSKVVLTALPRGGLLMPYRWGTSHPGSIYLPGLAPRPAALFDAPAAALTA